MQFWVIVVTDPLTNRQTGPITIHCTASSSVMITSSDGCQPTDYGWTRPRVKLCGWVLVSKWAASTSMNMSASDKVAEPARVILDMTMLSHVTVLRPSAFYRDRTPPVVWSHTAEEDARRSFLVARTTVTLCCIQHTEGCKTQPHASLARRRDHIMPVIRQLQ